MVSAGNNENVREEGRGACSSFKVNRGSFDGGLIKFAYECKQFTQLVLR